MPITWLAGERFGRLLVLNEHRSEKRGRYSYVAWRCRCDCGAERWVLRVNLQNGTTLSCGCLKTEYADSVRLDPAEKRRRRAAVTTRWKQAHHAHVRAQAREYERQARKRDPEKARERDRKKEAVRIAKKGKDWLTAKKRAGYLRNREKVLAAVAEYRHQHPEKVRASDKAHKAKNREHYAEQKRIWRNRNRGKVRSANSWRKKLVQRATPPWVDREQIDEIYMACPEGHHVDHVVPIRGITVEGDQVSGLHVPWNLQYLSAAENVGKWRQMRPIDQVLCELCQL